MNIDALLVEANKLVMQIDDLLWDLSMSGDTAKYERVNLIHLKAMQRYERRYNQWRSHSENHML